MYFLHVGYLWTKANNVAHHNFSPIFHIHRYSKRLASWRLRWNWQGDRISTSGAHWHYLHFKGLLPIFSIVRLPELEDIGRPRGWLNFFCFLPSDAPWPFQTAVLGAPCEPVHQTTQKDRQSSVICWENLFNVSVKIHSLPRASCWWNHVAVCGRFMGKPCMSKKPTKWGTKCFSLADSCNGYIINVLLCRRGAFSRTGCFFLLYAKSVPPSWIVITSPLPSQSCPLTSSGRSAWFFTTVSVKAMLQGPLLLQLVSLPLCHRRGCTTT